MKRAAIAWLGIAIVACDKDSPSPASQAKPTTGTIRGVCRYVGNRKPTVLPPNPAMGCDVEHDDESLRGGPDRAIADCVVWVDEAGSRADVMDRLAEPAEFRFVVEPCGYVPHVAAVRGPVAVAFDNRSKGDVNVHGYRESLADTVFNVGVAPGTISRDLEIYVLGKPGKYIVRSDMRVPYLAWLHVFHHPWFDVTTLSTRGTIPPGGFELRDVPAGDHIVLCWHEPVGRELDPLTASRVGPHSYRPEIRIARTLRVEVGGVATVDFEIDVGDR